MFFKRFREGLFEGEAVSRLFGTIKISLNRNSRPVGRTHASPRRLDFNLHGDLMILEVLRVRVWTVGTEEWATARSVL